VDLFNIITPCIRPQNLPLLLKSIETANINYFEVIWYIVFDNTTIAELELKSPLNLQIK